jgi:hypothetical protein
MPSATPTPPTPPKPTTQQLESLRKLPTIPKMQKGAIRELAIGACTDLDPQAWKFVAAVSPGTNRMLQVQGSWRPGNEGHHCWDPFGDSSQNFNGYNKWCVLVVAVDAFSGETQYIFGNLRDKQTFNCPGTAPEQTHIMAIMNDDDFGDNSQCDPHMQICG